VSHIAGVPVLHPDFATPITELQLLAQQLSQSSESSPAPKAEVSARREAWLMGCGAPGGNSRSALVLSGFNAWVSGKQTGQELGSGLLNATEFSALNLHGTELVMFSSCNSASGPSMQTEQSIIGMRRAAMVAGAESVVAALWDIPDAESKDLVEAFYGHLVKGVGRAEALRMAQNLVREKAPHPFFWASYICEGLNNPVESLKPASNRSVDNSRAVQAAALGV